MSANNEKKQPQVRAKRMQKRKVAQKGNPKKKVPTERELAIASGSKVSPAADLKLAQGVSYSISVVTNFSQPAVTGIPLGLISLAMSRGENAAPFAFYEYMLADIFSLLKSGAGVATSRIAYLNKILGSLVPKTVPFRRTAEIAYSSTQIPDTTPLPAITMPGGRKYYLYIEGGPIINTWQTQSVPGAYSDEEQARYYLNGMNSLVGDRPHNALQKNVDLHPLYKSDVSAYARIAPFYGTALGVGGPSCSVECEVPFRSSQLALQTFTASTPRTSRVYSTYSGDGLSNYAIGVLNEYPTAFYEGSVPPIYKFLDLGELAFQLAEVMRAALAQKFSNGLISGDIAFLNSGFSFSYHEFQLMLRQQVIWMFANSQCIGQSQTYNVNSGSFLPFTCGSNCYPRQPAPVMLIPSVINENLKMLKMCVRHYQTSNFQSARNHVTHIPVWGAFRGSSLSLQFSYDNSLSVPTNLFAPEVLATPDLWDGTMPTSEAADLNLDPKIAAFTAEWNDWINAMASVFSGISSMGGDASNSPLLQYTRYVNYEQVNNVEYTMKKVPRYAADYVETKEYEVPSLDRKSSKKEFRAKRFYNPPNSSPLTEFTHAISGMLPITATHKEYFPALIIPVIELSTQLLDPPGVSEVQSFTMEPYNITVQTVTFMSSRGADLAASVIHSVCGVAGKKTEMADFFTAMANANQGAFLGDLFAAISSVGGAIGLPGVGPIGAGLSAVANAFNI